MINSNQAPLTYYVDNHTKQNIMNGEYVNLAALLVRDNSNSQVASILSEPRSTNLAKLLHSLNNQIRSLASNAERMHSLYFQVYM